MDDPFEDPWEAKFGKLYADLNLNFDAAQTAANEIPEAEWDTDEGEQRIDDILNDLRSAFNNTLESAPFAKGFTDTFWYGFTHSVVSRRVKGALKFEQAVMRAVKMNIANGAWPLVDPGLARMRFVAAAKAFTVFENNEVDPATAKALGIPYLEESSVDDPAGLPRWRPRLGPRWCDLSRCLKARYENEVGEDYNR